MTLGICGSRTWTNRDAIRACVSHLGPDDSIVSGGASGADTMAEDAGRDLGIRVTSFRPTPVIGHPGDFTIACWEYTPRNGWVVLTEEGLYRNFAAAAYARNTMIAIAADRGCAFRMPGKSNGTDHCIKEFRRLGKAIKVFEK